MIDPRELVAKRNCGSVRYAVISDYSGDMNQVLAKFGLNADRALLVEHNRAGALDILASLLHRDMAYESELMPEQSARGIAEAVLHPQRADATYFSNGNWAKRESWNPLTSSTFDAGIIVREGESVYVCIWFQDED